MGFSISLTSIPPPLSFRAVIATLEQTKTEWARLLELAREGEEILITDGGQPIARLTGWPVPANRSGQDREAWLNELSELRRHIATDKNQPTVEELLDEDRAESIA